jgi:hypothetical protein
MPDPIEDYLGDGVYARWDGYGVWLLANDPLIPSDRIYIEPEVWTAMQRFMGRVK